MKNEIEKNFTFIYNGYIELLYTIVAINIVIKLEGLNTW